jgi:3-phenylpropionate/trans-cinnamate dioxygenase ferredoxin reductase subunit
MPETHVIAGAGLAGAKAAEALRAEGFEGRIVLVGDEPEAPYERPPLSKDYLRGESPREQARVHEDGFYAEHDIELLTGTTVTDLNAAARDVTLSTGERLGYDRLLLATGSEPRRLSVPGAELDGVHHLRTFADSDAIAAALKPGARAVIAGGGWIGMEVAASARQKGLDVTIVELEDVPLSRALGREAGLIYARLHREHGVQLHTGVAVARVEGEGRVERVVLADGRALDADLLVCGLGAIPRTELARRAGLAVENGVLTDASLQTSDPHVFAAGDIANAEHPFYGRRVRVEHWANALNQPEVAARAMLGKPATYDKLPYFFSDQYDAGMEYRGLAIGADAFEIDGDAEAYEFVAYWRREGRTIAAMNVNVWDVGDQLEEEILSRAI